MKSVRTASSCELLEDPRCRSARRRSPVAITGWPSRLQRAGDVDALAAGGAARLDRAVAAAELEVRHRDRAVDRRVEGDGEDQACRSPARPAPRSAPGGSLILSLRLALPQAPANAGRAQRDHATAMSMTIRADGDQEGHERAADLVDRASAPTIPRRRRPGTRPTRSPSSSTVGAARAARRRDRPLDLGRARRTSTRSCWSARAGPRSERSRDERQLPRVALVTRIGELLAPADGDRAAGTARSRSRAARSESASRSASLGAPSTTEISGTPLRSPEPTST